MSESSSLEKAHFSQPRSPPSAKCECRDLCSAAEMSFLFSFSYVRPGGPAHVNCTPFHREATRGDGLARKSPSAEERAEEKDTFIPKGDTNSFIYWLSSYFHIRRSRRKKKKKTYLFCINISGFILAMSSSCYVWDMPFNETLIKMCKNVSLSQTRTLGASP